MNRGNTPTDLKVQFKMDTGYDASQKPREYQSWLETKVIAKDESVEKAHDEIDKTMESESLS